MLTFGELSKIDEEILEFIEEVEEVNMLTDFYEWIELEDLGLGEDFLIEKESTAKYTQRMRKMGRQAKIRNKRTSFKIKKKRSQLRRKTATKIQTSTRTRTQRQVIPTNIMKAKGAAGIRKRKMWKGMKAAIINRKMKPMRRQIIRDEPSRIKQARKNMTIHKKSGR
jgi:Zn-dependent M32 family carboxypeptidase